MPNAKCTTDNSQIYISRQDHPPELRKGIPNSDLNIFTWRSNRHSNLTSPGMNPHCHLQPAPFQFMAAPHSEMLRSKTLYILNFSPSHTSHWLHQEILLVVLPSKYIQIRLLLPPQLFPSQLKLSGSSHPDTSTWLVSCLYALFPIPSKGKSDHISPPFKTL